jgi:DNA mismatch repair protein MutH
MKVSQALPILKTVTGKKFEDLFSDLPIDLTTNKGNVGQLLEKYIGLKLGCNLTDFSDGELKTNKSDRLGNPLETMFITQVSNEIDNLVSEPALAFEDSKLYKKIQNLVFLPICKSSKDRRNWFFVSCHHVDLREIKSLRLQIKSDYELITKRLRWNIENAPDGYIHTSNGEFIQVRSKDSKPYYPIYSKKYGRHVSNKNHAFYFKKEFMRHCRALDSTF